jgi:N-acetylglucosaminyldiphosphoundecaprenol N-acetyl-beta-D-mannosaminyltransferase
MLTGLAETQQGALSRAQRSPLEDVWWLVARLSIVADEAAEAELLKRLSAVQCPTVVAFVNQHAVNLAWARPDFAAALRLSDILLRDGVGIEYFLKLNGCPSGRNMNGTDFIPKLAAAFTGRRVAVLGTKAPWTGRAAAALTSLGCDVVIQLDGFQEDDAYIRSLEATRPELVIVAMGMPKQELIATRLSAAVSFPTVIVSGGAIADFLAGRHSRAPRMLREAGLEWLFRVALEPRRLAGRYLSGGATFLWRIAVLRHHSTPILLRLLQRGPDT